MSADFQTCTGCGKAHDPNVRGHCSCGAVLSPFDADSCVCSECGGPHPWWVCTPGHKFGEEPLEPYDDRNLGPGTHRITTRGERRAIMSKNDLEYVPKARRRGEVVTVDLGAR